MATEQRSTERAVLLAQPAAIPRYPEVVARQIRIERKRAVGNQETLAGRMRELGFDWHRATVSAVERAERRVHVEELLGLSICLGVSIGDLLAPSKMRGEIIALPESRTGLHIVDAGTLAESVRGIGPYFKDEFVWDGHRLARYDMPFPAFRRFMFRTDPQSAPVYERLREALAFVANPKNRVSEADLERVMRQFFDDMGEQGRVVEHQTEDPEEAER